MSHILMVSKELCIGEYPFGKRPKYVFSYRSRDAIVENYEFSGTSPAPTGREYRKT